MIHQIGPACAPPLVAAATVTVAGEMVAEVQEGAMVGAMVVEEMAAAMAAARVAAAKAAAMEGTMAEVESEEMEVR